MQPMLAAVQRFLDVQLARFGEVVDGLPGEALNWRPGDAETNAVAQLIRHVTLVQTNILTRTLGETPSFDPEYSLFDDPATKEELRGLLREAKAKKDEQLTRLDAMDLSELVPTRYSGPVTRAFLVIATVDHGQEHLGHAELTKQLWEQRGQRRECSANA